MWKKKRMVDWWDGRWEDWKLEKRENRKEKDERRNRN